MKKGELNFYYLIGGILALLAFVAGAYMINAYSKLSSSGLDWSVLPSSEQQRVTSNFDKLSDLLQSCNSKFNCLCGTARGFPYPFRDEEKIIFNNTIRGSSKMILMHQNIVIKEFSVNQDVFLNSAEYGSKEVTFSGGDYYIDRRKGQADRQAFSKAGNALYLFNDKVKKDSLPYKAFLNYTKIC